MSVQRGIFVQTGMGELKKFTHRNVTAPLVLYTRVQNEDFFTKLKAQYSDVWKQ